MRIPVSWIREYASIPEEVTAEQLGAALVEVGLELEAIEHGGAGISGPIVVGQVLSFESEPQKNGKVIRWCQVDVGVELNGEGQNSRGIICGADNFEVGDLVVVALPGAVLPGDFQIASRKTYGHISDGMLCAVDELGIGTDHSGIIILPKEIDGHSVVPGSDALDVMGVREDIFDLGVTPDMGYALSTRGVAREAAQAMNVTFTDPIAPLPVEVSTEGYPIEIATDKCSRFVALSINDVEASAESPEWMRRRLQQAGMRPISLAVDVTNYVMLETGQPLHAYDADKLQGTIVVRQAVEGEKLTTLDDKERELNVEDLVITDDSGVIGLAGLMGGASTEVSASTTRILLEAASFDSVTVARASRRHQLSSEASRRFERGVDLAAAYPAALRAARLIAQYGHGFVDVNETVVGEELPPANVTMDASFPAQVLGSDISRETVIDTLMAAGTRVTAMGDFLTLTPPSWRPDLREPIDFVEEIGRKTGLDHIAPRLPRPYGGKGLTVAQRRRRELGLQLAARGLVEVSTVPFISPEQLDKLQVPQDDQRRKLVFIANPLSAEYPAVRSTLLLGLLETAQRNSSRSQDDVAIFEVGRVFSQSDESSQTPAPEPGIECRPSAEALEQFDRALPNQPTTVAGLISGMWRAKDWQHSGTPASWQHAFELADAAAGVYGVRLTRIAAQHAPYHPGRCAQLVIGDQVVGYAGQLHPKVTEACSLPRSAAAFELDLELLLALAPGAGEIGPIPVMPVVKEDVALIVDEAVTCAQVEQALREGAGHLLEDVSLFDVYTGPQVGEGKKSLAFALRFRAPDRTLKQNEVTAARTAAVERAREVLGAQQRLA